MSSFEFTDATTWAGRPVARTVVDAQSRGRVVVSGTICATRLLRRGSGPAYCCTLDDGTGQLDLLFVGRRSIPGLAIGARCHAEGTARLEGDRLVVWNPLYELEASDWLVDGGSTVVPNSTPSCAVARSDCWLDAGRTRTCPGPADP